MVALATEGRLSLVTAPALEPVDLTEAKAHLRVDGTEEDTLIGALITAARERIEALLGRALVTQTWDLSFDAFPPGGEPIVLPRPPLLSVTSVKYLDLDGAEQTWASSNYTVDAPAGPQAGFGRIIPAYQVDYPAARDIERAVTVQFAAGYGAAATDVPGVLRQAILLLVAHLFEQRGAVGATVTFQPQVPASVGYLLDPYRMAWGIG